MEGKEREFKKEMRRLQNASKYKRGQRRREASARKGDTPPSRGPWRQKWIEGVDVTPVEVDGGFGEVWEGGDPGVRELCKDVHALLRMGGVSAVKRKYGGVVARTSAQIRVLRCKAHRAQDERSPSGYVASVLYHRDCVGAENTETSFLHANLRAGVPHPLFRRDTWYPPGKDGEKKAKTKKAKSKRAAAGRKRGRSREVMGRGAEDRPAKRRRTVLRPIVAAASGET